MTDQGPGIAKEDQERIFERFYRVDAARSRQTGGTGLGLSIVKHVMSNHGGEVALWSQQGSGSTFTVRLPQLERASTTLEGLGRGLARAARGHRPHRHTPSRLAHSAENPAPRRGREGGNA